MDAIVGSFIGGAIVFVLLAWAISYEMKTKTQKITTFIVVCVFGFVVTLNGVKPKGNLWIYAVIGWAIVLGIFWGAYGIYRGIKAINQQYVKPAKEKHNDDQREYKKYLICCDKKGKRPLNFKQWKFAYSKHNRKI